MQITQIEVKNLFGKHDYLIEFNKDDNIFILTGPNGSGKSTILRILYGLSNLDLGLLCSFPADSIKFEFDDRRVFLIKRKGGLKSVNKVVFQIKNSNGKILKERFKPELDLKDHGKPCNLKSKLDLPSRDLIQMDKYRWFNFKTGTTFTPASIIKLRGEDIGTLLDFRFKNNEFRSFFSDILKGWRVEYLDTKRLYRLQGPEESSLTRLLNNLISGFTREITGLISDKTKTRDKVTRQLGDTFDSRLAGAIPDSELRSVTEIRKELKELTGKWIRVAEALGIEPESPDSIEISDNPDRKSLKLLNLHVLDSKRIFEIYSGLYDKLNFYLDFLNRNLSGKVVEYFPDKGFIIRDDSGNFLDAGDLSSGEQHQLILWFEIIFRDADLILIDEPELSLHITWQSEFIRELTRFNKERDKQFVIATHSPDIIDRFWDLTLEL